jgi:hypothetical protein
MKTRSLSISIALCLALFGAALAPASFAQQMNYQGRLTDSSGNALQDGQYTLTFELFDAATAGARVWGPFVYDGGSADGHGPKADLVNGRFNVILGPNDTATNQLSGSFGGARYLQITVASNPPLLPRQQILSAPESLHAINADHATIADRINGSLNITANFHVGGNSAFDGTITSPQAASLGSVTTTGNATINGNLISKGTEDFGSSFRQMLNLYNGVSYGIGVQTNTEYFRSAAGFAWYRGGSHNNTQNAPGTGGQTLMTFDSNGLSVYGEAYATVTFNPPANKGNRGSHVHYGATGDWYIRSATASGTVYIQDQSVGGGNTSIGGYVGIGGAADFPLHVSAKRNYNFNTGVGDLRNYSGGVYQHLSSADDYSIVSDGAVWATSFQATSDRRIKSIDRVSDPAKDLETIQKLNVTDYHYIDTGLNGGRLQKGFIAQEVQAVIPEAVSQGAGYIPDIFAPADTTAFDANQQRLTVSLSKAHELKLGDKVRLLCESTGTLEVAIESIPSEHEFIVANCEKNPGRVFVYGKRVPDLMNLNYDRIFSTGIGAIQELARRVKVLEENQQRVAELEQKAERVDALNHEVAELREAVLSIAHSRNRDSLPIRPAKLETATR